jgi:hypothetical protein
VDEAGIGPYVHYYVAVELHEKADVARGGVLRAEEKLQGPLSAGPGLDLAEDHTVLLHLKAHGDLQPL